MAALLEREGDLIAEDDAELGQIFAEDAEDDDFAQPKEIRDVFDSDFDETSAEEDSEDEERNVRRAEKAERKKAKRPDAISASLLPKAAKPPRPPKRRKLSPGGSKYVGGETRGERTSTRAAAVEYKQSVDERLEAEEARRIALTLRQRSRKADRPKRLTFTQAELINEALETEEANRASLRAFYAAEAQFKESVTVTGRQRHIQGPTLTFISRAGPQIQGLPAPPQPADAPPSKDAPKPPLQTSLLVAPLPSLVPRSLVTPLPAPLASAPTVPDAVAPPDAEQFEAAAANLCTRSWVAVRDMNVAKEHVWAAVLGYHADWLNLRIVPNKNRALYKQPMICGISGRPATYKDPHTGVPFANAAAYQQLARAVSQSFVWHDALNTFV